MAKKDKAGADKLVKKVNKEFDKTSTQIEKLINDTLKQFDALHSQVQEPVRKLLDEVEKLREREMKRFNVELDRRLNEFHELQHNLLERVGLASKDVQKTTVSAADTAGKKTSKTVSKATPAKAKTAARKTTKPAVAKTTTKKPAARKPTAKKPAANASASTAPATQKARAAGSAAQKPAARKAPAAARPKAINENDLTKVKGVGPATAKKMQGMGITSIRQIANPNAAEQEKMKEFSSMKGFDNWPVEAKKLLS